MSGNDYNKLKSQSSVSLGGVEGTRWEYEPSDNRSASIVYYYLTKGDLAYRFYINDNGQLSDEVDLTATGEKIVSTFVF